MVAVDPPAGASPEGAACGIVAAGLRDGVVFVLKDASAHGLRPLEWAGRAVALARTVGAGVIVAEANQGGEMVRQVLEMAGARETCRIRLTHTGEQVRQGAAAVRALRQAAGAACGRVPRTGGRDVCVRRGGRGGRIVRQIT